MSNFTKSILFPFCLLPALVSANSNHIDSLKQVIQQSKDDFTQKKIINYYYQNYSNFKEIDSVSISFSKLIKHSYNDVYFENEMARSEILNDNGATHKATTVLTQLFLLKSVRKNQDQLAVMCNSMGNIYFNISNYPKSREFYRKYHSHKTEIKDSTGIKAAVINIGNTFYHENNFDSARYYFEIAEEMEKNGNMSFHINLTNNMALVYTAFDEHEKALKNYEILAEEPDLNPSTQIIILNNYAITLSKLQRYDDALAILNRAEEISTKLQDEMLHPFILNLQAKQYAFKEQFDQAYNKLKLSDSLSNENRKQEPEEALRNLAYKYENQIIEKENSLNQQRLVNTEKHASRLSLFILILGSLSLVIIFLLIRSRRLFKSVKQKNKELSILNETLDVFNLHVSHDLKTILNNTQSMSSMIRKYNEKDDRLKVTEIANKITQITDNGKKTISGFMELGKTGGFIETKQTRSIIPTQEINTVLTKYGLNDAIDLEITDKNVHQIPISSAAFESIFLNFFSNTIKYNKNRPKAKVTFNQNAKSILISYKDNGIGVDMENQGQYLFTPYKRIKNEIEVEGTGIGLFMVRKIILQHGGEITAYSKLDQGLRFEISLPIK